MASHHTVVFLGATTGIVYEEDTAELLDDVIPSCEGGAQGVLQMRMVLQGSSLEDGRSIDPQVDVCSETHLGR